ncbi:MULTISPECIES: ROK family protein [unclassified Bosea (in: a-proteobacteria)]|uniref:ROK family transcriptional regulator n=1 Tax=unclassified Bosea (in: a-proteobacteria) TaxID=2653178 RepID=UPI000F764F8A|nr:MULTISPECIES: ROK family protein [unclassified Bosea (in: a-proteobacteria)]AZO80115.1 sugar kinase [Bosea sp. Tri-49]RXT22901.1 sugar kinase [Bosea sp. Tri-39]RXT38370.1 sugar kinase [Bosea sp. Tri-54]
MPHRKPPAAQSVALGANPERARHHNRRVVLETLRQHGRLGRSDIANLTRLTAQAVSNIVAELLEEGFLVELGRRRTARGQPPVEFALNADGGVSAGMEIAADHITTVLVDLTGEIRAQRVVPLPDISVEAVQALAAAELKRARATRGLPERLLGCGVVMPGPFDFEGTITVGSTALPGWTGRDVTALMSAALATSVTVENDATAAAVGEHLYGIGRNLRHFCLVYFGLGLGLGLMLGGEPYRGAFGNAGELGHVPVVPQGLPCICGRQGCLESYVSPSALQGTLRQAGITQVDAASVAGLHAEGHPAVLGWIAQAGPLLAPVLAMLENLFDPETIILGGGLPDSVIDALIAAVEPLPLSVARRDGRATPRLQRGTTGQLTAALGAAALPLLDAIAPRLVRNAAMAEPAPPAAPNSAAAS